MLLKFGRLLANPLSVALVLMLVLAGCGKQVTSVGMSAERGVQGLTETDDFLAYEHHVWIELPAASLDAQIRSVRDACQSGTHGRCSLIEHSQASGVRASGKVKLRIAPAGVEAMVGVAAIGGEQTRRSTQAEDLAQAVADTTRQLDQLKLQRVLLLEFQQRKDLGVADMLSIAREMAAVETSLASAERDAAQQTLRLQTNLLTIEFSTPSEPASRTARLRDALSGSLDSSVDGLAQAIETFAYVLPLLLFGFPLALLWRWLWRKATR